MLTVPDAKDPEDENKFYITSNVFQVKYTIQNLESNQTSMLICEPTIAESIYTMAHAYMLYILFHTNSNH